MELILRLNNPTKKREDLIFNAEKAQKWKNYVTPKKIGNIINKLNERRQQTFKVYVYMYIHLVAHSNFFLASSAQRV